MEEWRDIPGYEGIYQASNFGRIRSCEGKKTHTVLHGDRHWKQRILKQKKYPGKNGRVDARVSLWKSGKERTWLVARLVGMAWCDGYSQYMTINHINGNSLDNRAENLEWVSLAENIQKGFAAGLYSKSQKPIVLRNGKIALCFESMAEASRFLGWNSGYINNCLRRDRPIKDRFGTFYDIEVKTC